MPTDEQRKSQRERVVLTVAPAVLRHGHSSLHVTIIKNLADSLIDWINEQEEADNAD